jgi:hypothetical protein
MAKKNEVKMQLDKFHDRGFSLPVKAIIELDFSAPDNWQPVTASIELEKGEHLDLLRAIVKRNGLASEEFCDENKSVTLSLQCCGLNFTLPHA